MLNSSNEFFFYTTADIKPIAPRQKNKRILEELETEVTRDLSFQELQRYVLLKQAKVLDMQINKF